VTGGENMKQNIACKFELCKKKYFNAAAYQEILLDFQKFGNTLKEINIERPEGCLDSAVCYLFETAESDIVKIYLVDHTKDSYNTSMEICKDEDKKMEVVFAENTNINNFHMDATNFMTCYASFLEKTYACVPTTDVPQSVKDFIKDVNTKAKPKF
jgi:hypothetical protein